MNYINYLCSVHSNTFSSSSPFKGDRRGSVDGWTDILEEALAFSSCLLKFAKLKKQPRMKVDVHVVWRGRYSFKVVRRLAMPQKT